MPPPPREPREGRGDPAQAASEEPSDEELEEQDRRSGLRFVDMNVALVGGGLAALVGFGGLERRPTVGYLRLLFGACRRHVPPRAAPPAGARSATEVEMGSGKGAAGAYALHVRSHYSLGQGAASVPQLVRRAAALGLDGLALTDLENLHGQDASRSSSARARSSPPSDWNGTSWPSRPATASRTRRRGRCGARWSASRPTRSRRRTPAATPGWDTWPPT